MTSRNTRRGFLASAAGTASALAMGYVALPAHALQHSSPQPKPSPNAPGNQNVPAGMNTYPSSDGDRPVINTVNGAQVNSMVQQLYQMTLAFKQEADQTNLQNTLPADFMKRAQQIEKLAKAIRERARG